MHTQQGGLVTTDLNHGVTPTDLVNALVGTGVTISNVTFTGSARAAGTFSGGSTIIGFESGIVLSSGNVRSGTDDPWCSRGVEGPNNCHELGGPDGTDNSTNFELPGDADLTALSGFPTSDAAVLEFDFVPQFPTVQFQYVFSSEEYSDYSNTELNDVFAFFVNGVNCALVPGTSDPVSINTINNGNDNDGDPTPHHPEFFIDNVRPTVTVNTQMDGLTVVLTCTASVTPGVSNHMKLAIADASDGNFDSAVLLKAASFVSGVSLPYAWGSNHWGQLGDGTTTNHITPVAVIATGVLSGRMVAAISGGGFHTVTLTSDAHLFAWGDNAEGELGNGATTDQTEPVAVIMNGALAGKTVTAISTGAFHTVALTADGRLFAWGYNNYGQLGDGSTTSRDEPVAVIMNGAFAGKTVAAISAGDYHTAALTTDGQVFTWGYNVFGQLGDGTTTNRLEPVAVTTSGVLSGKTVTAISAGASHILALSSDAQLFAWGYNSQGQLGDGTAIDRLTPVRVITNGALSGKTVTAISSGGSHSVALTDDHQLFAWGYNGFGQLGDGSTTTRLEPVAVIMNGALSGQTVTAVSGGDYHNVVVTAEGNLYSWGYNGEGQLGDGTTVNRTMPVAVDMNGVLEGASATAVSASTRFHTLALAVPTLGGPTLGNYPNTSLPLGTDITVTPYAPPTGTAGINVSTSTNFNGTLKADPATGVVHVTDAHPAGTYTVTVRAFNSVGAGTTKTFTLMVMTPSTCVLQAKARPGLPVGTKNFPSDVNANGAINVGDVSGIKSLLGSGLR